MISKSNIAIFMGHVLVLFSACEIQHDQTNPLEAHIEAIKTEYAPDKRVALFDVQSVEYDDSIIIKGTSNLPDAVHAFKEKLKAENIDFIDSIQLLPEATLEGKTQGVVKISVANLRSNPAHSSELATQATLGTPVKVYKKVGNWYLIQTPDQYLSWVDSGGIELMTNDEFGQWRSAEKIIFLSTIGHSYELPDNKSQVVSDLVAGSILRLVTEQPAYYKVKYPDGRTAFINKAYSQKYNLWLASLNPTEETLLKTSKLLMGLPYLWGGTSSKGVDCSGFTKTIYFLNGMVLPRDASQQVHIGKQVDTTKNFENLAPGDLLFFGKPATDTTKERVVHVGMWIGNNEFIHSSERVHISSVDKDADNYDEYNYKRYLRSKRILKEENDGWINLAKTPVFRD